MSKEKFQITMLVGKVIYENGVIPRKYEQGESYHVPKAIYDIATGSGWAIEPKQTKTPEELEVLKAEAEEADAAKIKERNEKVTPRDPLSRNDNRDLRPTEKPKTKKQK